ncbi:MAG: HAMP domain-containing histidine kinase [Phycisphaerales bacterium]|nr:HAMP domain-containing histidine kinase [Phycisphaerales bacterium]
MDDTPSDQPILRLTDAEDHLGPEAGVQIQATSDQRLAMLAHELGSLLDGSQRYLNLALRHLTTGADQTDPETIIRQLRAVHSALDRMTHAVSAFRQSTGGSSMTVSIMPDESLTSVIEHAVNVLRPAADEHGIDVVVDADGALAGVPAGPVYPIISNALRNALEASESGGTIHVEASRRGGDIHITVTDHGTGVDPNVLPRAFDFGVTTKSRGHGIGLALSRDIIREIGGTIALVNNPQDGATLRITFPVPHTKDGGQA